MRSEKVRDCMIRKQVLNYAVHQQKEGDKLIKRSENVLNKFNSQQDKARKLEMMAKHALEDRLDKNEERLEKARAQQAQNELDRLQFLEREEGRHLNRLQ